MTTEESPRDFAKRRTEAVFKEAERYGVTLSTIEHAWLTRTEPRVWLSRMARHIERGEITKL